MTGFDTADHEQRWAVAEQGFMRFIGLVLLIAAIISMIFGTFPDVGGQLVWTFNIIMTLLLGLGSLWSFWWSMNINRILSMMEGFKRNGSGRTYAVAVLQTIVGLIFVTGFAEGQWTQGFLGAMMLASAVFFVWRGRQIEKYS